MSTDNFRNNIKPVDPMGFVSTHIFVLKWTGQWFNLHPYGSIKYWRSLVIKHLVLFISCTLPIIGEIYYLCHNHDDIGKLAECLYLMLSEIFCPVKVAFLASNKLVFLEIMRQMKGNMFRPTEPEHADIIRAAMRKGRLIAFTFGWMCLVSIFVALVIPIFENFEMLPTNIQYPYIDEMSTPAYQLIYLLEVLYKPTAVMIFSAIETLPELLMSCAIAQLEILTFNLEHLDTLATRELQRLGVEEKDQTEENRRVMIGDILGRCINHYSIIADFVSNIEKAYGLHTGTQFLVSALVICLTGVQFFSIEDPLQNPLQLVWMLLYLTNMILAIFMVCYFGDEVTSKSDHLTTAAYNSPWTTMREETKASLIIFRERCRRPLTLHAANLIDISLITFTSLMRWSFNVFAVMNQMQ